MSNSSSSNTASAGGGIGVFGLLGVIFLTLKILGIAPVAAWSWWWVLAPFWGPFAIAIAIIVLVLLVAGLIALINR